MKLAYIFFSYAYKTLKNFFSKILCLETVEISSLSLHIHLMLEKEFWWVETPFPSEYEDRTPPDPCFSDCYTKRTSDAVSLWLLQEKIKHTPNRTVSSKSAQVPPCSCQSLQWLALDLEAEGELPFSFRWVQLACSLNI